MYYSEDGCVMLHDARAERRITRAQATLQQAAEFSGAFFHPRMEHLFATSDVRGNVRLRDTRMAFGPLHQRTKEGIVHKVTYTNSWCLILRLLTTFDQYVTRIARRSVASYVRPEASSIAWDRDGEFLENLRCIDILTTP